VQQGTAALPAAGEGDGVWVKASECRHWAPDGGTAFLVTDAGPAEPIPYTKPAEERHPDDFPEDA
jgi:hypothetical protein